MFQAILVYNFELQAYVGKLANKTKREQRDPRMNILHQCVIASIFVLSLNGTILADDPISLFDGKSFNGWEGDTKNTWRIEDGAFIAGSHEKEAPRNEFLSTKKTYSDFELKLKFKIVGDHKINAGVQFRTKRIPNHHEVIGFQADIGTNVHGYLYDESRRRKFLAEPSKESAKQAIESKPADGWETYRIRAKGNHIQLWLNGIKTVDYVEKDDSIEKSGVIAIQIHGKMKGTIAYKDITIKDLSN